MLGTAKFLLTFKYFHKLHGDSYEIDTTSQGWATFYKAIQFRNGAVHPKTPEDILLAKDKWNTITDAYGWFLPLMDDTALRTGLLRTRSDAGEALETSDLFQQHFSDLLTTIAEDQDEDDDEF